MRTFLATRKTAQLRHPAPSTVQGLLSVKNGGHFSKRVRRLAQLTDGVLEFRAEAHGPVESSIHVVDVEMTSDESTLSITLSSPSILIRLYAPTASKYDMWFTALSAAVAYKVETFYKVSSHVLGSGKFGVVRSAVAKKEGDEVAIKTLKVSPRDGPYLEELTRRECRISRMVAHEGIVPVLDVFETRGRVDIVMKCLPYTLHDVMETRVILDEYEAAAIIRRILSAVAYLHCRSVVHRDIKPDNILCSDLFEPSKSAAICDFSLANFTGKRGDIRKPQETATMEAMRMRYLEEHGYVGEDATGSFGRPIYLTGLIGKGPQEQKSSLGYRGRSESRSSFSPLPDSEPDSDSGHDYTQYSDAGEGENSFVSASIDGLMLTSAVGAPSYVAPELVRGQRHGKPVDVWGCGVLLYYMLVGYLPFEGKCPRSVLRRIRECRPDYSAGTWSRVSESALNFVKALLHPDPLKRITAESALSHEWLATHSRPLKPVLEEI